MDASSAFKDSLPTSPDSLMALLDEIGVGFSLHEHPDFYYILPKKKGKKAVQCLSARFGADLRKLGFVPPHTDENPTKHWVRSKDDPINIWSLRTAKEEAEYEASIAARNSDPFAEI